MRNKGFTLIELLVVISVIAVLMAIMLPTLARARQQGKAVMCLSNLRQLAVASQVYINNNDGYYPIAYMYKFTDSMFISYAWDFTSIKNWDTLEQRVIPGLLWQSNTIEKIQQCPSLKDSANWLADPYTGYNYNTSYIGHGQGESIVVPAMAAMVKRPSQCALFGDGQYADGANKFMRAPLSDPAADLSCNYRYAGTQGYRHNGKTNVVWCDGHASSQRELYKNIEPASQEELIAPGTGFLSPDNSAYDLK